jgi:electron transport complex protein RnfG
MAEGNRKGNFIAQAWLVILLALVYGSGLATVHTAVGGKIAENKRNETYNVIPDLVEGADKSRTVERMIQGKDGKEIRIYQVMAADGGLRGWVVPAGGQGFSDRIEVLIGLDPEAATITGLYVLDQKETPGLGDYITGEDFRNRFRDKPTDGPLAVVKTEPRAVNEVRALTGATISSESVSGIVNAAVANLKEPIRQLVLTIGDEAE